MVWMPSPDSGTSTTTVVSASLTTSSSVWPTPTVSTRTQSNPAASRSFWVSAVARASPPRLPRVAMLRMKTPGSRVCACIRIRSPRTAPPGERARRIDRDDADGRAGLPDRRREPVDERALPRPRGPGDADRVRAARPRVDPPHDLGHGRLAILDARDEPGERPAVAAEHPVDEHVRPPCRRAHRTAFALWRRRGPRGGHAITPSRRKRRDRRRVVAQAAEHLVGVLAQLRRGRLDAPRRRRHLHREGDLSDGAELRVRHLREEAALRELRVPDDLVERQHRSRADVGLVQELDPLARGSASGTGGAARRRPRSRSAPSACWSGRRSSRPTSRQKFAQN